MQLLPLCLHYGTSFTDETTYCALLMSLDTGQKSISKDLAKKSQISVHDFRIRPQSGVVFSVCNSFLEVQKNILMLYRFCLPLDYPNVYKSSTEKVPPAYSSCSLDIVTYYFDKTRCEIITKQIVFNSIFFLSRQIRLQYYLVVFDVLPITLKTHSILRSKSSVKNYFKINKQKHNTKKAKFKANGF